MKFRLLFLFICIIRLSISIAAERPNILWITSEDNGADLGAYGSKYAHTPALDALAKQSSIYTQAFATAGVCAPARSTIITGMYPARLGAHNMRTGDHNNFKWPEDVKIREDKGVLDKLGNNVPDYEVVTPDYVKPFTEYLRAEGFYCVNDNKCDYQFNAPFTAWDDVYGGGSYKNSPINIDALIVYPKKGKGPYPILVFNHSSGGASLFSNKWFKFNRQQAKMLLKKGIAVMFVDNFNGRNVISAGADQAQVSTYSFYIDAFMTLEYLSKDPKINIKKVGITGWSRGGMNSLAIAEKRIRDILISKDLYFKASLPRSVECRQSGFFRNPQPIKETKVWMVNGLSLIHI